MILYNPRPTGGNGANNRGKASDDVSVDPRSAACCLGCSDQAFQLVFFDEAEADRQLGKDQYFELQLGGKGYFVASWSVYDRQQQERVLIETVYRLLFEPRVFNNPFIHEGGRILGNVKVDSRGEFNLLASRRTRPKISGMPNVHEISSALRSHGFFSDTRADDGLIKIVRAALPS